jgi:4'-phosphopantetheinyl transferase
MTAVTDSRSGFSAATSTTDLLWSCATSEVRLAAHEIHVWCAALGDFYRELPRLQSTLSPDEHVRAGKFRSIDDRDAFVIGRGILRALLGRYLGRGASTINFSYGPFGKPDVIGLPDHGPIYFNASRSDALVVYAVTSVCPVGVDIERVRPVVDFEFIASRFVGPLEADRLMTLPPDRQMDEFFVCWTCKEAFVKATGKGLGRSPQVDQGADASPCAGDDSHLSDTWRFQLLRPAAGYVGALAHRADDASLLQWRVSNLTGC